MGTAADSHPIRSHGMYSVILDAELDGPKQYFDGYATTDILNSTLFSANNLSPGFHQAIIVNEITRTGISGRTGMSQRMGSSRRITH